MPADDDQQQDDTQQEGQSEGSEGETPEDFEVWLEDQDDEVQSLYQQHTSGLKSALDSERETRSELEKRVRELAEKAEDGSEAKKELESMADDLERRERQAQFYEDAHAAGVANLKLAYIAARENEMFDRRGNVDFEAMQDEFPELFGGTPAAPDAKAGAGSNTEPPTQPSMNDFIRTTARRR